MSLDALPILTRALLSLDTGWTLTLGGELAVVIACHESGLNVRFSADFIESVTAESAEVIERALCTAVEREMSGDATIELSSDELGDFRFLTAAVVKRVDELFSSVDAPKTPPNPPEVP